MFLVPLVFSLLQLTRADTTFTEMDFCMQGSEVSYLGTEKEGREPDEFCEKRKLITHEDQIHMSLHRRTTIESFKKGWNQLGSITHMSFRDLSASSLPENIFSNLTHVEILYLTNSRITSLEDDSFAKLENLEILNLSFDQISEVSSGAFNHLSKLKSLDLENNNLISLPKGIFAPLTSLERLSLRGNNFTSLDKSIISGLKSLKTVELSDNPVSRNFSNSIAELKQKLRKPSHSEQDVIREDLQIKLCKSISSC